ncbi:MAG TPA: ABC transporter ATP-binding protein [Bacillota bacterium]|nr:ABC transporter ATP-binding protein [Candidatus Fermentithermobacillaceae bacterium]HOK64256.1 ABC transporter ATP-binding protein [Bacillota bacterium]HOL11874.1 ABC transporter ATP-binding protein [Bacillota bacterium]HOQ02882.1 ABC transporter ATP-binding protein [Bacillota bacterium]HPP60705.1 ABC transporter ATP-binding protein [Bacillota bacterium]
MIKTCKLCKEYVMGKVKVQALRDIDIEIPKGQFVAIMGPSGSGKSTLMNILGCLDKPTSGQYYLDREDVSKKSDDELAEIRNQFVGFIFQSYNLLPRTDAVSNVELPLIYRGISAGKRREMAMEALESVGLSHRARHKPSELSGGEQQRVAVARAIVGNPKLILADEPTGNLDSRSGEEIMVVFQELHEKGITLVLVSHDPDIARHAERIVSLRDGRIISDEMIEDRLDANEILSQMPEPEISA